MKRLLPVLACLLLLSESRSFGRDDWGLRVVTTTVDIVIARPFTFAATLIGAAVWTATLPITIPTKTATDSREVMIDAPWQFTFHRPLGDFEE
jgi:hypothetical protein